MISADKAGGKRFSRDFEEGSTKLQDFVRFLEEESKGGSGLLEALGNADIFYEMQYQEVKIVANVSDLNKHPHSTLGWSLELFRNRNQIKTMFFV